MALRVRDTSGIWRTQKTVSLNHGVRSFRVPLDRRWLAPGVVLRAKLVGNPTRLTVRADDKVPAVPPLTLALNTTMPHAWLAQWADVRVEVPAGRVVNLLANPLQQIDAVLAPGGIPVPLRADQNLWQFTSTTAGTYTLRVGRHPVDELYASTPKVVDLPFDSLEYVNTDVPGQFLDVRFPGVAGQAVALTQIGETSELLDPSGQPVPVWLDSWVTGSLYRLPANGDYTLRYREQSVRVAVWDVPVLDATVDGAPVQIEQRAASEDAVVLAIDNPDNLPWSLRGVCGQSPGFPVIFRPSGEPQIGGWRAAIPEEGTYYVVIPGAGGNGSGPIQVSSGRDLGIVLDGDPVSVSVSGLTCEWLRGSFYAEAGEVVWLDADRYPGSEFEIQGPAGVIPSESSPFVWVIPETGTYVYDDVEYDGYDATWALRHGPPAGSR